jgi:hypothetical protein
VTVADLRPPGACELTVDTRTAAAWLGVGYETLLDAAKAGAAPVAPVRVGRIYRWPTRPLLELLGMEDGSREDG